MKYLDYEELIVLKHSVELKGWTFKKFASPSSLSTSLSGLCKLLGTTNNSKCTFVKLTLLEAKKQHEEQEKWIHDSTMVVKTWKLQKDISVKQPWTKGKKKVEDEDN